MKRFHVHVSVGDLNQSIQFYTELFGSQPSVLKSDYASTVYGHDRVRTEPVKAQEAACCAPKCCSPEAA